MDAFVHRALHVLDAPGRDREGRMKGREGRWKGRQRMQKGREGRRSWLCMLC